MPEHAAPVRTCSPGPWLSRVAATERKINLESPGSHPQNPQNPLTFTAINSADTSPRLRLRAWGCRPPSPASSEFQFSRKPGLLWETWGREPLPVHREPLSRAFSPPPGPGSSSRGNRDELDPPRRWASGMDHFLRQCPRRIFSTFRQNANVTNGVPCHLKGRGSTY